MNSTQTINPNPIINSNVIESFIIVLLRAYLTYSLVSPDSLATERIAVHPGSQMHRDWSRGVPFSFLSPVAQTVHPCRQDPCVWAGHNTAQRPASLRHFELRGVLFMGSPTSWNTQLVIAYSLDVSYFYSADKANSRPGCQLWTDGQIAVDICLDWLMLHTLLVRTRCVPNEFLAPEGAAP